jgi:hypothetical protein
MTKALPVVWASLMLVLYPPILPTAQSAQSKPNGNSSKPTGGTQRQPAPTQQQRPVSAAQQSVTTQQPPVAVAPPKNQAAATGPIKDADAEADKQEARLTQRITKWSTIAQAASAIFVTVFTGVLVYYSHRGWVAAKQSADAAKTAADAATEANRISRDIVVIDQRPWIAVDVGLAGPISQRPDKDKTGNWYVSVKYELHHLGKTPATNVSITVRCVPFVLAHWPALSIKDGVPQGEPIAGTDVAKEVETVCLSLPPGVPKTFGFGHVVFPQEKELGVWHLPLPTDGGDGPAGYTGQFLIVFGVTYGSTLDPAEQYTSARTFNLFKRTGDMKIRYTGEPVGVEELRLVRYPEAIGSRAT